MKKVLLGILIGAVGVYGYNRMHQPAANDGGLEVRGAEGAESGSGDERTSESTLASNPETSSATRGFHCDGRQYCSQMGSYEEAVYFLRNCPDVKMDGDLDGVPCEQQFNK